MISTSLKRLYKKTIPGLPGYHSLCLLLRKVRPARWTWVERVPVKPGLVIPVQTSAGAFYMTRPERCSIAKKFFWTEGRREPVEDSIALDLFAALVRQSDVVVDIGANSGLFSLVAALANRDAKIVAIDILPEAFHILVDNLIVNGLLERVEIQLAGVGRKNEEFHAPFDAISSEMPTSLSLDHSQHTGIRVPVPVRSLDDICLPRFSGKLMAVKIDVEGTEADIFENGLETLRTIRPRIICEVLPGARRVDGYGRLLDECGYRKYLITDRGLRPYGTIQPDPRFKDWFFIADSDVFDVTAFIAGAEVARHANTASGGPSE